MEITKTRSLTSHQFEQINRLWNEEYPVKLKDRFGILLEEVQNYYHYIIEDDEKNVLAWAVYFEKENEIRFSIIVGDSFQGKGFGKMLLEKLKQDLTEFYGWVIDHDTDQKASGKNYKSPLGFYLKNGFEIVDGARIDNEMLKAVKIKNKTDKI